MPTTIRRMAALKALAEALRGSRAPGAPSMADRFSAVPRMVSQGLSGRYPHLDRSRLGLAALALLYIVSPIDLMPEALLSVLGLGDDAFLAAWLAGTLLSEADTFLSWEKAAAEPGVRIVDGELLD